jgi:glutamate-1-semialdehyde 2,1-aminomutase
MDSGDLFDRARRLLPGGVDSPVRAFGAVGGTPVFVARAEGAFVHSVEGRRYLDLVGSWGPMILGHAHPRVVEAVRRAAAGGTSFGMPCPAEVDLAAAVTRLVPSVEMVRFTCSGTEATGW